MLNPLLLDRARSSARRSHVIPHRGHPAEAGPEVVPRSSIARRMKSWWEHNVDRVHAASERLRGPSRDTLIFHELADVVGVARDPIEIESALMRLACRMSGAPRAELVLESNPGEETRRGEAIPIPYRRLLARWPEAPLPEPSSDVEGRESGTMPPLNDGDIALPPAGPIDPLDLTVREGRRSRTMLRLMPAPGRSWSPRLIRRLTTLCTLAAAARLALASARTVAAPRRPEPLDELRDEPFFRTFLPYAVATAKRHQEPISLVCVAIDRFAGIESLLGRELAEAALRRLARTIVRTLRCSDIVARLGEGRIIAALGLADHQEARIVAENLRLAIAGMGAHSSPLPMLTTTIGVASYPDDATDAPALIAAAAEAADRRWSLGPGAIASPSGRDSTQISAGCFVDRRES